TVQGRKEHILEGLRAGANDYVSKPFDPEELRARIDMAAQLIQVQLELAARVRELEVALAHVKLLQGLLPICAYCKNVRDDQNYWHRVEEYLHAHTGATVTSGVCPACWEKVVKPEWKKQGINLPDTPP